MTNSNDSVKEYLIHDNGGRPYKVSINYNSNVITIYKKLEDAEGDSECDVEGDLESDVEGDLESDVEGTSENEEDSEIQREGSTSSEESTEEAVKHNVTCSYHKEEYVYIYNCEYIFTDIFVGISERNKMTEFSGGYGPQFDGNTILFKTLGSAPCEYIFLNGHGLQRFTTESPIVKFVSDVGNSDVPYPYAIDEMKRHYLLIEDIVLLNPEKKDYPDVYEFYYANCKLCEKKYAGITAFYIDDEYYWMSLLNFNDYENYYDYEIADGIIHRVTVAPKRQCVITIVQNGEKRLLDEEDYVEIMNSFMRDYNYKPLIMEKIHDYDYCKESESE
jgi:hypothetical protein